ncbi:hypothetical protein LIA77_04513 [Sarocladium implicatum]|nr:hypothetical protein LIA77_04513 [Sarocladium implicatum]
MLWLPLQGHKIRYRRTLTPTTSIISNRWRGKRYERRPRARQAAYLTLTLRATPIPTCTPPIRQLH